ncbi:MAG TPA: hypothetical protein VG753_01565 [Candidatus Paceibacterota bacterium]|nr:hypothetical protein [Candidatus Paceibacterota bacterium]
MRNKEEKLVEIFVAHLAAEGTPGLKIDRWPDREPENRNKKAIDAIAGSFAIEHTSIDALDEKRARDTEFMQAIGNIEADLKGQVPFRLRVRVLYKAVGKGQKWLEVRAALRTWVLSDAMTLPEGFHSLNIPGVPFDLQIEKTSEEAPGLFVGRLINEKDLTLESTIGPLLIEKATKLLPYGPAGLTRILLLETSDTSMMNRVIAAKAIHANFPDQLPHGIDEIWYADTALDAPTFFHLTPLIGQLKYPEEEQS